MKRFKIFFLNSLLLIISSFILQLIKLIFNIYVSNHISSEALGVFQLIIVTYSFGITLASSGINISCIRIVSEELAIGNNYEVRKSSSTCIKISLLISLFASFIFFINSNFIVKYCFQSKVDKTIVYLICVALPLISISSAITGYFTAVRRIYKTILGQFLEQISKIIATMILFKIYSASNSLQSVCFCLILWDVISEFVAFLYLVFLYNFDLKKYFPIIKHKSFFCNFKKNLYVVLPLKLDLHHNKFVFKILKILIPISVTTCIKSGISTIKQLIIPSSLEKGGTNVEQALSEYGTISGMAFPIIMFPAIFLLSVSILLIPEFSRYYVKNDYKKIKKYTKKLLLITFLFSIILMLIFFVFGKLFGIIIYNNPQVGSYIKIMSFLIPFMYIDIIVDNILKGLDAQTSVMVINIIDLIISISFIVFIVPNLGIIGYIISIFISELINFTLSLKKLIKLEKSFK